MAGPAESHAQEFASMKQLEIENDLLKKTLATCIDFKRILEHMFQDQSMAPELAEYQAHFRAYLTKYNVGWQRKLALFHII